MADPSAGRGSTPWPAGSFGQTGGGSRRWRPFFLLVAAVFLVVPISGIVENRSSPLHAGLAVLAIGIVALTVFPMPGRHDDRARPWLPAAVIGTTLIASYLAIAATDLGSWLPLFYFASI